MRRSRTFVGKAAIARVIVLSLMLASCSSASEAPTTMSTASAAAEPVSPVVEIPADVEETLAFLEKGASEKFGSPGVTDREVDTRETKAILKQCAKYYEGTLGTDSERKFLGPTGPPPTPRDVIIYATWQSPDQDRPSWIFGAPSDDPEAILPLNRSEIESWGCLDVDDDRFANWTWNFKPSADTSRIGTANSGAMNYGDNADLDRLWDACAADANQCFHLYRVSPDGSDYDQFGGTCGDRAGYREGPCSGPYSVVP